MKTIILMGMKHSGKSTLGKLLGERLGLPFFDLDDLLIRENPDGPVLNPREVSRQLGSQVFQDWEAAAAERIAGTLSGAPCVLALGGGTIKNSRAMNALTGKGLMVFIDEDEDVLFDRIIRGGIPTFLSQDHPREDFHDVYRERTDLYKKAAEVTLDCRGLGIQSALKKLIALIKE